MQTKQLSRCNRIFVVHHGEKHMSVLAVLSGMLAILSKSASACENGSPIRCSLNLVQCTPLRWRRQRHAPKVGGSLFPHGQSATAGADRHGAVRWRHVADFHFGANAASHLNKRQHLFRRVDSFDDPTFLGTQFRKSFHRHAAKIGRAISTGGSPVWGISDTAAFTKPARVTNFLALREVRCTFASALGI